MSHWRWSHHETQTVPDQGCGTEDQAHRIGLEGLAVDSAARTGSEEDIRTLENLLIHMSTSVENHKRFSALDVDFHIAIAKASGNPLLSDLISLIRGQLAKGLARVLMLPGALPLSFEEHLKIVQKIQQRDPTGPAKRYPSICTAGSIDTVSSSRRRQRPRCSARGRPAERQCSNNHPKCR